MSECSLISQPLILQPLALHLA